MRNLSAEWHPLTPEVLGHTLHSCWHPISRLVVRMPLECSCSIKWTCLGLVLRLIWKQKQALFWQTVAKFCKSLRLCVLCSSLCTSDLLPKQKDQITPLPTWHFHLEVNSLGISSSGTIVLHLIFPMSVNDTQLLRGKKKKSRCYPWFLYFPLPHIQNIHILLTWLAHYILNTIISISCAAPSPEPPDLVSQWACFFLTFIIHSTHRTWVTF